MFANLLPETTLVFYLLDVSEISGKVEHLIVSGTSRLLLGTANLLTSLVTFYWILFFLSFFETESRSVAQCPG